MRRRRAVQFVLLFAAVLMLGVGLALSHEPAGPADDMQWPALGLTIIVTAALLGGHLAVRFGQAAVLGELVAGMVLGNLPGLEGLQFVGTDTVVDILARVGMLLLLFEVGLDLSVRDLFAVGPSALLVATIGTISSFAVATGTAALLIPAAPGSTDVFLGAALTATSVGITARVLKDMGASRSGEAQIILGAAVVDDVLALVVLAIAAASFGSAGSGAATAGASAIAALVMKSIGFLVLAIALGTRLTPTWFRHAARLRTTGALLAVGLCFCFFLSWAASSIGLATLVGAFAAGLVLEDTHSAMFVQRGERPLSELLQPMTSFLVPVFFVLVGFRANIGALTHSTVLLLPFALSLAAVIGKLSCVAGVVQRGVRKLPVAIGMIPRGEVALVFAALGKTLKVGPAPLLDEQGYTAIVAVVILTTLITPPALKWSLANSIGTRITRPAA